MRRAHVMPGGTWPPHMGFSSRMGSKLDRNASELVNMTDGGTWTPSSPICIGGRGTILDSSCQITGGITTKPGYGGKKPQIELDDQWPVFSAPRTRVVTTSWLRSEGSGALPVYFSRSGTCTRSGILGSGLNIGMLLSDHQIHDGATLTKATCSWRYTGSKPAAVGSEAFSIIRYLRATDAATTSLHTAATVSGITYAGYTSYRVVATVEEFYGGGNVISIPYEPDQNNVIDKATYYYGFGFNTNLDAEMVSLKLEYTVPSMKWE